ncbi:hypothetical protein E2C01_076246 [Portunus trituberculatus]|uniref:Ig-like domain-containing protein n=1 Tax=Portunus trituberculatus TaxID=210409 RepID=A0A5B7IIF6_PORTR|nr:hypothetical protein [Portunus trituberculatus]
MVTVMGERKPLSAGRPYDIQCLVMGARPPAIVTWRLDDARLNTHSEKTQGKKERSTWREENKEVTFDEEVKTKLDTERQNDEGEHYNKTYRGQKTFEEEKRTRNCGEEEEEEEEGFWREENSWLAGD